MKLNVIKDYEEMRNEHAIRKRSVLVSTYAEFDYSMRQHI